MEEAQKLTQRQEGWRYVNEGREVEGDGREVAGGGFLRHKETEKRQRKDVVIKTQGNNKI